MGLLVDGVWHDRWYGTAEHGGRFVRPDAQFRDWLTAPGAPVAEGKEAYPAEPGRYRLYVSLACPWAHRTLILRRLKGLETMLPVSVVHWHMDKDGWTFAPSEGVVPDPVFGAQRLHEIYSAAKPGYSGRVTVPVLLDTQTRRIVNNESSEIIRMLTTAFDGQGAAAGDYYPPELRAEIDRVNARVYDTVNNGVYKAGFATTQEAYQEAVIPLFATLDWLEDRLAHADWLVGNRLTEADIRLFTTLVRFDAVYVGHFKCNLKRIVDYPRLWAFSRRIYQMPQVRPTVNFTHIKRHYYMSHPTINPSGIVPLGPEIDWDQPVT